MIHTVDDLKETIKERQVLSGEFFVPFKGDHDEIHLGWDGQSFVARSRNVAPIMIAEPEAGAILPLVLKTN